MKASLSYEKYLLNKYFGDDRVKLEQIHKGVLDQDSEGIEHFMSINGVHNSFHAKVMIQSIRDNYDDLKSSPAIVQEELSEEHLESVVALIKTKC